MNSFEKLRAEAEEGNADAQVQLGAAYEFGNGIPKDTEKSIYWYLEAARQGHAEAQAHLGYEYELKNPEEAAEWYRLAADQDNADAQLGLGLAYYEGNGVETDFTEAAKWLSKAVEHGNEIAMFNLGYQYHYGEGVPQDFERAEELYSDYLYCDQIGSGYVEYLLGDLYSDRKNPCRDDDEAYRYYLMAAERGLPEGQHSLGDMYRTGASGLDIDLEIAVDWYREAAEGGHPQSHFCLGEIYGSGEGVRQDVSKAFMHLGLAVNWQHQWDGVAKAIESMEGLVRKMTPEQMARAQQLIKDQEISKS